MTHDELDDLCEQFEDSWDASNTGFEAIRSFVSGLPNGTQSSNQLMMSLAQTDMEMSWVTWDKELHNLVDSTQPEVLLEKFDRLPRARNYFELFDSSPPSVQHLNQLVRIEADCRTLFGDCMSDAYYQHSYGVGFNHISRSSPRSVNCRFFEATSLSDFKLPLRGRCVLGRQRTSDLQSRSLEELSKGIRIVIAGRQESEISREQLACQLISNKIAVVKNLSSVNPLLFGSGKQLACFEAVVLKFPFTIELPRRLLTFA